MATCTTETGRTIRLTDTANTTTQMELDMKVTGMKISSMGKARKSGPTMPVMRANTKMERNMEEVSSYGQMDRLTLVISLRITFTEWACIPGRTAENTMVNGRITRWTVKECSLGPTEEGMMVSTSMTRKKDRVFSRGQMDASTMATGKTESNMAREYIIRARVKLKWESGLKASVSTGFPIISEAA